MWSPTGFNIGSITIFNNNDIVNSSTVLAFVLFADDTNIVLSHTNLNELINTLNAELTKVSSWFKCNKLSLNISKTNFMHYQTTHTNIELPCNIIIDTMPLVKRDNIKFLGISIDKLLTWNQHVSNISISIAKAIGILYKVKNHLLEDSLLMIYNTLILPYLNYCNIVWGYRGGSSFFPRGGGLTQRRCGASSTSRVAASRFFWCYFEPP